MALSKRQKIRPRACHTGGWSGVDRAAIIASCYWDAVITVTFGKKKAPPKRDSERKAPNLGCLKPIGQPSGCALSRSAEVR